MTRLTGLSTYMQGCAYVQEVVVAVCAFDCIAAIAFERVETEVSLR
jgi:hypothetical protein